MPKFERILELFPAFYAATERTKLLYEIVRKLAQHIEEADTHLFRIQRSHRLRVAEHVEDIIKLAAVLNLTAFHFEDILVDKNVDYGNKLDLMRERIQRVARVHINGTATPWAIMEGAAIFLNATIVPEKPGDKLIKHLDQELFSHKAIIEFTHLPEKTRKRMYLHENPFRRKKVDMTERWPMNQRDIQEDKWPKNRWEIQNNNFAESPAKFVIKGVEDRTVLPTIQCFDTKEGILFNGIVPDGKTLVIDEYHGAMLDNNPVDDWITYFKDVSGFVSKQGDAPRYFDGDMEKLVSKSFQRKKLVPKAPVGKSIWYFNVAEGIYDESVYDYAVYATNHLPIGRYEDNSSTYDNCVFDYPPSGIVGMAWDERIPCTFKLLLPKEIPQLQNEELDTKACTDKREENRRPAVNYVSRVGNIIPRFKAAGIHSFVDTVKDSWVLGESFIRNKDAVDGEGVKLHSTRLQNQNADIYFPLSTTYND